MTFDGRIEAQMTLPAGLVITGTTSADTSGYVVPAGKYYMTPLLAAIAAGLNAGAPNSPNWSATLSTGASGTGQVSFSHSTLVWSLQFSDANFRSVFGFSADILTAPAGPQTSPAQARSLWLPDCPVSCETDPRRCPKYSDRRETMAPTGDARAIVGNFFYMHRTIVWGRVAEAHVWERSATLANASWEKWFDETQNGNGLSYFSAQSKVQIYTHTGGAFGADGPNRDGAGVTGWKITGVSDIAPRRADPSGWTGQWTIAIPQLVTSG